MHTNSSGQASEHTGAQKPLLACDRSRRKLQRRTFKCADEHACLFQLTVRCAADDAAAVDTLVREALGENLIAQRHQRMSKASGKQFRELEVIVRCANSSRRPVMAMMGRLEHEALTRGVVWESLPSPAPELDLNGVSGD
jgi:hypothetical protein